ncbi:hypothetical protein GCM10023094_20660 [Rhodococcus olei]|uniref:Lipoprotein n=1 Tax=Rhodococcus olei TaxID=2161675 RepID=A0ABP8P1Q3_9NOCA
MLVTVTVKVLFGCATAGWAVSGAANTINAAAATHDDVTRITFIPRGYAAGEGNGRLPGYPVTTTVPVMSGCSEHLYG